jgi:hypothetical protein
VTADKRTAKVAGLYAVGVLGALALMLAGEGVAGPLGPVSFLVLTGIAVAWSLAFAGQAWRRTDEAAQEAHKFAWFWGAPSALVALMLVLPVVAVTVFHGSFSPGFGRGPGGPSPWTLVIAGVALAALVQVLGYAVVWTAWWLKRR